MYFVRSLSLFVLCALSPIARGQVGTDAPGGVAPRDQTGSHAVPTVSVPFPDQLDRPLDVKESTSLAIADAWARDPQLPASGPDGRVMFLYGQTLPSVVCSPLQVTDIELQRGEIVRSGGIHLGDSVRWSVSPSISGPDGAETTHLVVKPAAPGLVTSLAVYTNRRTYYFRLVSHESRWTPRIAFNYTDEVDAAWIAYELATREKKAAVTVRESGDDLTQLDFEYRIRGAADWTPVRVWNDGIRTTIQFSKTITQGEAPALLVIGPDGKDQLVNYRVKGDRYVVDNLFKRAVLIAGVGRKQTRVEIIRKE